MGYYSDVALCLTAKGMENLAVALAQAQQNEPENFTAVKDFIGGIPDRKDQDSGAAAFLWEGLKWYSEFEDVAFVEKFIAGLEYADYYFIRVGEDDDDTEVKGGFWDNPLGMRLTRGIAFT